MKHVTRWYNPVSIDDLADYIEGKADLPKNPIALTFDGGYMGNYKNAYPILKNCNIPATIYPVTGSIKSGELPWTMRLKYIIESTNIKQLIINFLKQESRLNLRTVDEKRFANQEIYNYLSGMLPKEKDRIIRNIAEALRVDLDQIPDDIFLTWDQIKEMDKEGLLTFGSHTMTHPVLSKMPADVIANEVAKSKSEIEMMIGRNITSFCYPDGVLSENIKKTVQAAGYLTAISTIHGLNDKKTDPYELKRIASGNSSFTCVFALNIAGILGNIRKG